MPSADPGWDLLLSLAPHQRPQPATQAWGQGSPLPLCRVLPCGNSACVPSPPTCLPTHPQPQRSPCERRLCRPWGPTHPESVQPCWPNSQCRLRSPGHRRTPTGSHLLTAATPPPAGLGLLFLFPPECCFLVVCPPWPTWHGEVRGTLGNEQDPPAPRPCSSATALLTHSCLPEGGVLCPEGSGPLPGEADSAFALKLSGPRPPSAEAHRPVLPGKRDGSAVTPSRGACSDPLVSHFLELC